MTNFEQNPFDDVELVENPEPRHPVLLPIYTSYSMQGAASDELNEGLGFVQLRWLHNPICLMARTLASTKGIIGGHSTASIPTTMQLGCAGLVFLQIPVSFREA